MTKDQLENLDRLAGELHQIALVIYRDAETGSLYGKIENFQTVKSWRDKAIYALHLSHLFYDEEEDEDKIRNEEKLREVLIEETIPDALANEKYWERERRILENQNSSKE